MSRATFVRILSQPLTPSLTRAQAMLACDVGSLYAAAGALAEGKPLSGSQLLALHAVRELLSSDPADLVVHPAAEPEGTLAASVLTTPEAAAIAEAAAVEQRRLLASTVVNTLMAANWTVTVVAGEAAGQYTGIEASRGIEHLIAGVSHGELIVDQAGTQDRDAVEEIIEGLREIGCVVALADGPAEESGGLLYALTSAAPGGQTPRGEPSLAHAIQARLGRQTPAVRSADGNPQTALRRESCPSAHLTAGSQMEARNVR